MTTIARPNDPPVLDSEAASQVEVERQATTIAVTHCHRLFGQLTCPAHDWPVFSFRIHFLYRPPQTTPSVAAISHPIS